MFNKILSIVRGIRLKLAIAAVVIVGCFCVYEYVYHIGYNAGVDYVSNQIAAERKKWEASINQLQKQHESEVAKLNTQHANKITQLNKQITQLKQDPTIINKYLNPLDKVGNGLVLWHDRCALGQPLNTFLPSTPSNENYTLGDVANKIAINYNTCNLCIDRLTKLQAIVNDYIEKQNNVLK